MRPKISVSILGIFCISALIFSPHFDLAQAAPAENSNEDYEDFNSIEKAPTVSNSNSNLNSAVPGEERGGHFEGDMILSELAATSGLRDEAARWPNAVVIYKMDSKFSRGEVDVIKKGMAEISDKTCVQFKARTDESAYVQIVRGELDSGCNSHLGFHGDVQRINLEPVSKSTGGCIHHGVIVHEILHTLGFFHEQSRTDRDDFVKINTENIRPEMFSANFQKYGLDYITDFNISYDYDSIMHYGASYFAVNPSLPTIIPRKAGVKIGQREKLSEKDVQKINAMYSKNGQKCFSLTLESKIKLMSQQMSDMKMEMEQNKKSADSYVQRFKARLYSGSNFTGVAEDYNISPYYYDKNCYNLQKISANVRSIQTFDSCVRVYEQRNCNGFMRTFLPRFSDHENISGIKVASVGPCFEVPHFGRSIETLRTALLAVMDSRPKARLYSQLNQTGEIEEYNVVGAYDVSCKNLTVLAGKVKSVDNLNRCVRLFTGLDCTGMAYAVNPLTTIETRDNITSLATGGVRSVGPCWEFPYGQHSLLKLKTTLDKLVSES